MPQNAAIYYHSEGYDTSGDRLMGRHAAGEGFLTGLIRHSGVSPFVCFARGQEDFADFSRRLETLGGTAQPTRWIPHAWSAELADPGCLYYPGPNLGELAWLRRAVDPAAYSLCGVSPHHRVRGRHDGTGPIAERAVSALGRVDLHLRGGA